MKVVLAFPVFARPAGGAYAENTAAMDWFVLATLACWFFLLGCFATWAFLLWRRSARPKPHIKLIMELEEADHDASKPRPEAQVRNAEDKEAWERPADWWKNS